MSKRRPAGADTGAGGDDLAAIAARIRGRIVAMSHRAGSPHLGSSLSCVDILVAAYFGGARVEPATATDATRDRVILSKGHAAPALYAVLAERGYFDAALLDEFNHDGAVLAEQPAPGCVPGMEAATGSLGHGLPLGVGMALAARVRELDYRVTVVMSDGECNEGSVWEAAMFAPARALDNLCVVVDFNRWQATARSEEVMALQPLADKWRSFGWEAFEVDGHDVERLTAEISAFPREAGKPTALIAHTVKGKGVSFMEDDNNWHYRIPTAEEVGAAWRELGLDPASSGVNGAGGAG